MCKDNSCYYDLAVYNLAKLFSIGVWARLLYIRTMCTENPRREMNLALVQPARNVMLPNRANKAFLYDSINNAEILARTQGYQDAAFNCGKYCITNLIKHFFYILSILRVAGVSISETLVAGYLAQAAIYYMRLLYLALDR